MVLNISINPATEDRLSKLAQAAGKDLAAYVSQLVEQAATKAAIEEVLEPLRKQFTESCTSDEHLVEEITHAQGAYRAESRKKTV